VKRTGAPVRASIIAGCAVLAFVFAAVGEARADDGRINSTAIYAGELALAAKALDAAADGQRSGAPVPALHVPPAPLPGPPRFSPSLDGWLQQNLTTAREEKDAARRAKLLRDIATSLRLAAHDAGAPLAGDPTHALGSTLAAILGQPAYHEAESSTEAAPHKTWWDRFIEWLAGLFENLFDGVFKATANVPWLGRFIVFVVVAVFAAAFAALIVWLGWLIALYLIRTRGARVDRDVGELIEQRAGSDELLRRARTAAARGEYALAISLAFRAALRRLDAGGVIAYDSARTAGEYRRAVRRSCTPAAPPFDELAHTFTLATYAEAPVEERDWQTVDDAYGRFDPAVPKRDVGTPV
jgi:hypothetical protein